MNDRIAQSLHGVSIPAGTKSEGQRHHAQKTVDAFFTRTRDVLKWINRGDMAAELRPPLIMLKLIVAGGCISCDFYVLRING
jgi:hypothetical protein